MNCSTMLVSNNLDREAIMIRYARGDIVLYLMVDVTMDIDGIPPQVEAVDPETSLCRCC